MNKIFIENQLDINFEHEILFNEIFNNALKIANIEGEAEVSVEIVDNVAMQKLCKQYKGINKSTDVLAFEADWRELEKFIGYKNLGDIVISYEKVAQQALEYGHSEKREWAYLFTHACLHLLGYNHNDKENEKIMNEKANQIMLAVKVER